MMWKTMRWCELYRKVELITASNPAGRRWLAAMTTCMSNFHGTASLCSAAPVERSDPFRIACLLYDPESNIQASIMHNARTVAIKITARLDQVRPLDRWGGRPPSGGSIGARSEIPAVPGSSAAQRSRLFPRSYEPGSRGGVLPRCEVVDSTFVLLSVGGAGWLWPWVSLPAC